MSKKLTIEEFIENAIKIHGDLYDYSLVEYVSAREEVIIKCRKHGPFPQTPNNHVSHKNGCPTCKEERCAFTTEIFIERAREVHGDLYDYSLVNYKNSRTKVQIICRKHGPFPQSYAVHVYNECGCPICNNSKGEISIRKYLKENNIEFTQEKTFDDCKNKRCLPFDFYLSKYITLLRIKYNEIILEKLETFFRSRI